MPTATDIDRGGGGGGGPNDAGRPPGGGGEPSSSPAPPPLQTAYVRLRDEQRKQQQQHRQQHQHHGPNAKRERPPSPRPRTSSSSSLSSLVADGPGRIEKGQKQRHGFLLWHPPSLALLVLVGTFLNMEYSILMPTVWSYVESMGGSKAYLGYTIAAFSLSRMLVFGPVGYLTDHRPMRETFALTCFVGIIGNALYGLAGKLNAPWLLILARFLCGAGATNAVTSRAYLARVTTARARTTAIAVQNGIQFLGVIIGPALNLLFTRLDFNPGPYIEINQQTAAGYFMVLPNALCLAGFLLCFAEPPPPAPLPPSSPRPTTATTTSGTTATSADHEHEEGEDDDKTLPLLVPAASEDEDDEEGQRRVRRHGRGRRGERHRVLVACGGWWCLYTGLVTTLSLSALETALTPITQEHFHWSTMQNSYLFSGLALAAFGAVIFTVVLGKRGRPDREIIAAGFLSLVTSLLIQMIGCGDREHVALWAVVTGGVLLAFSLVAISSPNASLYSKMVGDAHQGRSNSLQFLCIATGRCVGPLLAGFCLADPHLARTYYPFFGLLLALALAAVGGLWRLWGRFSRVETEAASRHRAPESHASVPEATGGTGVAGGAAAGRAKEEDEEEEEGGGIAHHRYACSPLSSGVGVTARELAASVASASRVFGGGGDEEAAAALAVATNDNQEEEEEEADVGRVPVVSVSPRTGEGQGNEDGDEENRRSSTSSLSVNI